MSPLNIFPHGLKYFQSPPIKILEFSEKEGPLMRIEAYTQVQQLYQTKKVNQARKSGSVSHADQLQISNLGKDFQTARAAVAGSPDIREELTAPIKAKIQSGTYSVDNESFAEKLLKKYEEMR